MEGEQGVGGRSGDEHNGHMGAAVRGAWWVYGRVAASRPPPAAIHSMRMTGGTMED